MSFKRRIDKLCSQVDVEGVQVYVTVWGDDVIAGCSERMEDCEHICEGKHKDCILKGANSVLVEL